MFGNDLGRKTGSDFRHAIFWVDDDIETASLTFVVRKSFEHICNVTEQVLPEFQVVFGEDGLNIIEYVFSDVLHHER